MQINIKAVYISIEIKEGKKNEPLLSIFLHSDGAVNRMGNGTINSDKIMYMGQTQGQYFAEFMNTVGPEVLSSGGRYDFRENMEGTPCKLEILFEGGPKYEYLYGSESEGPNEDICELVQSGIKITDEWLKGQKDKNPKNKKQSLIRMLREKFRTKSSQ